MERNETIDSEIVITRENLPEWMAKVASLREEKRKDMEALKLARKVREEALKLESHEDVVNLYWEDYLIGKHILMHARDEETDSFKKARQFAQGFSLMRSSAKSGFEYANQHGVEKLKPRTHRFSGEIAMISRDYQSAIKHFETGIRLYEKMENPEERWNTLEFQGFLAEALVLSGKVKEGVDLAQETFGQYDWSDDGLLMKGEAYYQWAVWKSGCMTKLWNALLEKGGKKIPISESKKSELVVMLLLAEGALRFADGSEKQGDFDFGIRKAEIGKIKKRLGLT